MHLVRGKNSSVLLNLALIFVLLTASACRKETAPSPSTEEAKVWAAPALAPELLEPPDNVYARRAAAALARHQGDFQFAEEPLVREMWEYPATIEIMNYWGASLASRLLRGEEIASPALAAYSDSLHYQDERTEAYLLYARKSLGERLDYYTVRFREIDVRMMEAMLQGSALLEAAGDSKSSAQFAVRAQVYGEAANPVPGLADAFAVYLPDQMIAAQERHRAEIMASLDELALQFRFSGKTSKTHYLSRDAAIRKELNDRNISWDAALMPVVQAFVTQYRSDRMARLEPFFREDEFPREELQRLGEEWEGWRLRELGPLVLVRRMNEESAEVSLPDLLMSNEAGDLWKVPTTFMVRKDEQGRYQVMDLRSAESIRESTMKFEDILEKRMQRYYYEQNLERQMKRVANSEGGLEIDPAID